MSGAPIATCAADALDRETIEAVAEAFARPVVHTDAPEGLSTALNEGACALLIVDAHAPGVDAHDVCRACKSAHPEVPVVLCAPSDDVDTKLDLLGAGADQFLVTPLDEEALRFVLQFYLVEKGR